jgi:hypothetical protein
MKRRAAVLGSFPTNSQPNPSTSGPRKQSDEMARGLRTRGWGEVRGDMVFNCCTTRERRVPVTHVDAGSGVPPGRR